ncbi:MAG: hypothetical protein GWN82_20475, partial [Gemmatimonadetes bacterium]|nr:hypothetical protein [Gemmatimonadota bacterium]NIU32992.1 hypothetical protein [Gemmatimonadota bacterium]NIV63351.1 hypothetical protein [Gemmatimonadota bacterium]NIW66069.1 hypothetical protein [Gemmatimonadota bacterium]NIX41363.1 hypothetical protein [Gemmatimonadota bacterium]
MGTGPAAGGASVRTLKTLSDPRVFLGELPLVYQRLFTLEAIDDPSLLAAR